ncbi:MAG: AGE family epimerase/isomerase [Actinomycetales bacterium]
MSRTEDGSGPDGPRPGSWRYRRDQRAALLRYARGALEPSGFGYLDDTGHIDAARGVELWITCRMTHVLGLGVLAGEAAAPGGPDGDELRALGAHGVAALLDGPLRDQDRGGWYASVPVGGAEPPTKQAYGHAFVLLAASTALTAGIDRADELVQEATAIHSTWFWDDREGLVVEEWDASWQSADSYRGVNSCMHTVEAYLALGAATGERLWHRRAARIARRVVGWAMDNDWRVPEHFDEHWRPMLEHNTDRPADPFRPYGATVGHALEWARLLATIHTTGIDADPALMDAAVRLADRAVTDGWSVDGADGFVYTTDWQGSPVVRERMHWVVTEAIATSTVLHWATGDSRHAHDLERWWAYAHRYLIDPDDGSWRHELTPANTPGSRTWSGRPDVYHAYQAALMADTLGAHSFAAGVAASYR